MKKEWTHILSCFVSKSEKHLGAPCSYLMVIHIIYSFLPAAQDMSYMSGRKPSTYGVVLFVLERLEKESAGIVLFILRKPC